MGCLCQERKVDTNFNLDHQSNGRPGKAREGVIITRSAFGKSHSRWQVKNVWNGAKVVVPGVWAKHDTAAVVGKIDAGDILRYGCSSLFILMLSSL